jgi:hypothetical protein
MGDEKRNIERVWEEQELDPWCLAWSGARASVYLSCSLSASLSFIEREL